MTLTPVLKIILLPVAVGALFFVVMVDSLQSGLQEGLAPVKEGLTEMHASFDEIQRNSDDMNWRLSEILRRLEEGDMCRVPTNHWPHWSDGFNKEVCRPSDVFLPLAR